jgi:CrcB protein
MKKYIFIAVGGFLGANLRFFLGNFKINNSLGIPFVTLLINITGSFLLALFLTISLEILEFDSDIRIGISTGFFGAYTTFSTLCKEITLLIFEGNYIAAITYITMSLILGLFSAYLGIITARKIISQFIIKEDK